MITFFYITLMLSCLIFILLNTKKLIKNLNRLQGTYFRWINKFQVSTLAGKIDILATILFFGLIAYWLLFENKENYGYAAIFFFLLTLSNYPKWLTFFGKNGIVVDNDFISWDKIKKWEINGNNFILDFFDGSEYSKKTIKMIPKFRNDCENLLSQNSRQN